MAQSNNTTTETPKLKIKTTITEKKEIDIEVDSPYFCKYSDGHLFKVEQEKTLSVKIYGHVTGIELTDTYSWEGVITKCEKCSEEEFNQAYETALHKLQTHTL